MNIIKKSSYYLIWQFRFYLKVDIIVIFKGDDQIFL